MNYFIPNEFVFNNFFPDYDVTIANQGSMASPSTDVKNVNVIKLDRKIYNVMPRDSVHVWIM